MPLRTPLSALVFILRMSDMQFRAARKNPNKAETNRIRIKTLGNYFSVAYSALALLQDRNVGVGVLPERGEVFVRG